MYGLIFDVDGVIADTEAVNARASIEMFDEVFGLAGVKREDFEKGLGRGAAAYVRAAAQIHGFEMSDQQIEQATKVRQEKFLEILKNQPLPAFPGVLELIAAARQREDFITAIATSSTREKSMAVLESAKIPWREMTYVTGSEIKNKKPDPELFLTAAEKATIAPQRCVVIEDAPNGVQAALTAGCKCIAVTNSTTPEKLSSAHRVVTSLKEITIEDLTSILDNN